MSILEVLHVVFNRVAQTFGSIDTFIRNWVSGRSRNVNAPRKPMNTLIWLQVVGVVVILELVIGKLMSTPE